MGIHIPQSLLYASKNVNVTMDLTKLTDRQILNLTNKVMNGHIPHNTSATSYVANWIVKKFNLAHFKSNGWRLYWRNLPQDHDMYDRAIASLSLQKLDPETAKSSWKSREIQSALDSVNERRANSYIPYYVGGTETEFKKFKKESKVDHKDNTELMAFLLGVKNRQITEITIDLYKESDNEY